LIRLVFFLWCNFTGHCRPHCPDPSRYHGDAAFDQSHSSCGDARHSRLGQLEALAAHPGHSPEGGSHRSSGEVEQPTCHSPHHACFILRVVFLQ
ncbi:hypothetical protein M9458_049961, partial [Cirrhinus mrigala]